MTRKTEQKQGKNKRSRKIKTTKEPKDIAQVVRRERRRHLDERLHILHQRAMLIEEELRQLDDDRFYRVCIFGSARLKPETPDYQKVFELARFLSWEGIDVLTGGGPGLMEAANRGAKLGQQEKRTKSLTYGISIELEWEVGLNTHLDIKKHHYRFSSRLDEFMRLSHAVVATPGGIGTLLELIFTWQLVQVKHMTLRPLVLMDKKFWGGLISWMKDTVLSRGLVCASDFNVIHMVDTPEEALKVISDHHLTFRNQKASK
ncbi:MAG: LOG family protein [Deltaproteobacteria bacterium]|nr:LOG family protein [Deltaproteobacteria bacterium]